MWPFSRMTKEHKRRLAAVERLLDECKKSPCVDIYDPAFVDDHLAMIGRVCMSRLHMNTVNRWRREGRIDMIVNDNVPVEIIRVHGRNVVRVKNSDSPIVTP